MPNSKILQVPKIIEIKGATIRIAHPDISKNLRTYLSSPIAATGTAMVVRDNTFSTGNGVQDNDWLLIGEVGDSQTEAVDVNGTPTRGTSLTVTNSLAFGHEIDAPVTMLNERRIRIFGAATNGGSGTLITSVNALANDAVDIQWNRAFTEYTLISTDTTYAFYYVTFDDGTTQSSASDYVAAAGLGADSVFQMIEDALVLTDTQLDPHKITLPMCVKWTNAWQQAVAQFWYVDPFSEERVKKDWSFEIKEDITSLDIDENENSYALSGLTDALKYPNSDRGIISVRMGDKKPMMKVHIDDIDRELENKPFTRLNGAVTSGATSITVDDTTEFADSGTLYIANDKVTYTAKTATTFTGIPASGSGSITANRADNLIVWQGIAPGQPDKYTIFNGNIIFNKPPHADYDGFAIKIRYYKELTALTEASDTTEIPFTNTAQLFIGARMETRKGNAPEAQRLMQEFEQAVQSNARADKGISVDEYEYYTFDSSL